MSKTTFKGLLASEQSELTMRKPHQFLVGLVGPSLSHMGMNDTIGDRAL
jgi:hypothetical protein